MDEVRVGGFRCERLLGQGASGKVYLARETDGLQRTVALKLFAADHRDAYERELEMVRRIEEVRREGRVDGLVQSLGAGEDDGRGWIALEYLEGGALSDRVEADGPVSPAEATRFAAAAARALGALHTRGLFHRDVKPANLLLGSDGRVRLGDFGLSRELDGTLSAAGSPAFAAPEVIAGKPTDGVRVDVYSLGATLAYLLCGETMLPGRPDLFALERAGVPRPLQQVVACAMALEPEERYPTAEEMVAALEGVTETTRTTLGGPEGRDETPAHPEPAMKTKPVAPHPPVVVDPNLDVAVEHARCPFCHEPVRASDADKAACGACMAWHHGACWSEHGRCAACEATTLANRAAAPSPDALKKRQRAAAATLVGGLVALLGVGLMTFKRAEKRTALLAQVSRRDAERAATAEREQADLARKRLAERAKAEQARVETTAHADWTLRGPLPEVVAQIGDRGAFSCEIDLRLVATTVDLRVTGTWYDALKATAEAVGAGLVERSSDRYEITLDAVEAPFSLIPRQPFATEPAATAPDDSALAAAQQAGLSWLIDAQLPNGAWAGPNAGRASVGATSLAMLSLVGNGYTHRFGDHRQTVARALRWLKSQTAVTEVGAAPVLDKAFGAWAIAETYAVSRDFTLKEHALVWLRDLLALQRADGGFGFAPGAASNSLATVHAAVALRAARLGQRNLGLLADVPGGDRAQPALSEYLARVTDDDGLVGFRHPDVGLSLGVRLDPAPASAPVVPLFTAGVPAARSPEESPAALGVLLSAPPTAERVDPAYWWLASASLVQAKGFDDPSWLTWTRSLRSAALASQRSDAGALTGSWDPAGVWGGLYGRAGATAGALLALQFDLRTLRREAR